MSYYIFFLFTKKRFKHEKKKGKRRRETNISWDHDLFEITI